MSSELILTESPPPGFDADRMVSCGRCTRPNPPTRLNCFYCSAELDVDASAAKLDLRQLEAWEKGINVVLMHRAADANVDEVVRLLGNVEEARETIESGQRLPLARTANAREADLLAGRLAAAGIETRLISDEELDAETPPVRLKGIAIDGEALGLFPLNEGPPVETALNDVRLIVTGTIFATRTDRLEQRKRRGNKPLEENQSVEHDPVIDIYPASGGHGCRISSRGFDFSCLGPQKSLIAGENLRKLAERLRAAAPQAEYVEGYSAAGRLLGSVWPLEATRDGSSVQRSGLGRIEISSSSTVSNWRQFNKYSRLQRCLL